MELAHYFHIYAAGAWQKPLQEHADALSQAGWENPVHIGVIGPPAAREVAIEAAMARWSLFCGTEADEGYEQLTLDAVRDYALGHDGAVLYCHTKGAADPTDFNARWRRSMTKRLVLPWRENLAALEEYDIVGSHWLTPAVTPEGGEFADGLPFFGGNFWMARCDYLRTLPECPLENRWQAEHWIGMGTPRVLDLLPGWPGDGLWPELCE